MIDNILDGLKGQVIDTLKEKTGLDANQAEQTLPIAKDSITSGLMGAVSSGNISDVMGMFSGGSDDSAGGMMQNMVYKGIAQNFISNMTAKLGIPESMAGTVSSFALPMIMDKIKGEASDADGNINQGSLLSMFTGGGGISGDGGIVDNLKDQATDMLEDKAKDLLGGFFGK